MSAILDFKMAALHYMGASRSTFVIIFGSNATSSHLTTTDWKLCLICQEDTTETLTKPDQSKRKDIGSGYSSLAENLIKFSELGELPRSIHLERLDDGHGIEAAMVAHGAQYHQKRRLQYNNTKRQTAQMRSLKKEDESDGEQAACKCTRSHSRSSSTEKVPETCFFCEQPPWANSLRKAATFQMYRRVCACSTLLGDTELLGHLSGGDMVALDAQCHPWSLIGLYNRTRKVQSTGSQDTNQERAMSAVVFAELALYIEETRQDEETAPVFRLADLVQLYQSTMEQLGVQLDTRVHSTRLKQRLLAQFPDMWTHTRGRDILIAFEEDLGLLLTKPAGWTVIVMQSILPVLHTLFAITCLEKPSPSQDSLKDVKKNLCHRCCLL